MPRGLTNCNPGNIRRSATRYKGEVQGSDPDFKCFASPEWGYRAVFVLLHTYRLRHGADTIRRMIERYAPDSENDTAGYIRSVHRLSGIGPDTPLDTLRAGQMLPVVGAISRVENGIAADEAQLHRGWELFRADFS